MAWESIKFSPITPAAGQYLQRVWREAELPEMDFRHWSLEFAREMYEVIAMYQQPFMVEACAIRGVDLGDELLVVLDECGVFDEDPTVQQWVPLGWKPPSSWDS